MGRHKIPVLTKQNGSVLFDADYEYYYGRCDVLRTGKDVTIAAMGGTVAEALSAWSTLKEKGISAEVVIVSSIKQFDTPLFTSLKKTKKLVTVEDHNTHSGLASQLAKALQEKKIVLDACTDLGVKEYQLSGKWDELYAAAGIDRIAIVAAVEKLI